MNINRTTSNLCVFILVTASAGRLYGEDPVSLNTVFVPLANVEHDSRFDLQVELDAEKDSHPLLPTLQIARDGYQRVVNEVRDYTCVMVKREHVAGQLRGPEFIFAKVRHEQRDDKGVVSPFSIYMKFKGPASVKNREVLFVRGRDDDRLIVRNGGKRLAFLTFTLEPASPLAMMGSRYPITEFGIKRLIERMIVLGKRELAYQECEVEIRDGVTLDDQVCKCIEVKHPVQRDHFQYHLVKIYIDDKLQLPIRFESYAWPEDGSDVPILQEEYTYHDIKLNVGLTDADFQRDNPDYRFR